MLTCKELTELVTDYLEDRLSFRQRLAFHLHVGMCKDCRAYLRQMRMTVRTVGTLPDEPMPASVRDDLLARFRNKRPRTDGGSAVSTSLRLLADIERAVGGQRGWAVSGLMFVAALLALIAFGLHTGSFGEGSRCLAMEMGAGILPITFVGLIAFPHRARISVGTLSAVGTAGGLVAFAMLQATCPSSHVAEHVLVFHLGGMVFAGLTGVAAARLLVFR